MALYDQLLALTPTDVVRLQRAVATAEVSGPAAALEQVDQLDLGRYAGLHVARAELLLRLGRAEEAVAAYDIAISLTDNAPEREHLARRRRLAGGAGVDPVTRD